MLHNYPTKVAFERLSFIDDVFFDSFTIDGSDMLGLENIPRIIYAAGLCICLEGESIIALEAQSYHLKKGDMCVVFPNDILHVIERRADFKGYTVACTPEFLMSMNIRSGTSLYLYIKDNPCISLHKKECRELIKMCDFLKYSDSREDHPCRNEISRFLASAIIYEVIGIYKKGKPLQQQPYSRKNKLYFEFMQLVTKNFNKQRDLQFYADNLCITPRYLSAVCKEITGTTAAECIAQHVMVNARLLLSTSDMTILQVSEELNFPNPSFFTQYFKKYEGVTPKVYRNTRSI